MKRSLSKKLALIFTAIIVVFVAFTGLIAYRSSSRYIKNQTTIAYLDVLNQVASSIDYILTSNERMLNLLAAEGPFQDLLYQENANNYEKLSTLQDMRIMLDSLLNTYETVPKFHVYFYRQQTSTPPLEPLSRIEREAWKKEVLQLPYGVLWDLVDHHDEQNPNTVYSLRAAKRLPPKNGVEHPGILSLEINPFLLFKSLQRLDSFRQGDFYIVDRNGSIVFHPDQKKICKNFTAETGIVPSDLTEGVSNPFRAKGSREPAIVLTKSMEGIGWTLVGIVPISDYLNGEHLVRGEIIRAAFCAILIGVLLIGIVAHLLTKRIAALNEAVGGFDVNREPVPLDVRGKDEVAQLSQTYYEMSLRLRENMKVIAAMHQRELALNSQLLQAQINPHFLYNTLSAIKWMATGIGAQDISEALGALSKYYRIGLSRGQDLITIATELDYLNAYIFIQQLRLRQKITFDFQVSNEVLGYILPKMTLQPIVENAITHGIESVRKTGSIVITGRMDNGNVLLSVQDDGAGFPDAIAQAVLDNRYQAKSFGLNNVIRRIQLCFGADYGLSIRSSPGNTLVTVCIPPRKENFERSDADDSHDLRRG